MGNFYTNIALKTTEREAVMEHMRVHGRSCFISPVRDGFTTVFDLRCEEQNVRDLQNLGSELSSHFHCAALGVLNHDDDILWLGLFRDGDEITVYRSDQMFSGSAWHMAREFDVVGLVPLVWLLMRWPIVLFQTLRHRAITRVLGIPDFTVGFGYDYLSRGELPDHTDGFDAV